MTASTIVTYDELESLPDGERAGFVREAVERHRRSEMHRNAVSANAYFRQRNETIARFTKLLYTASGEGVEDYTASSLRMASNLFKRLNTQRCMYSLGKGVTFVDPASGEPAEDVKAALGQRFDDDVKQMGTYALIHGIAFPFWNLDHLDVFGADEFCPIWDARSGAMRAGIRFWRLDPFHPMQAVLYEEDGYTEYAADGDAEANLRETAAKRPYKVTYSETPADGLRLAVGAENYSRLPIVPVWGSDARQSTLVGLREHIDAYDLVKSGLANDTADCAQIYWLVKNAGGMSDEDLQEMLDRARLLHVVSVRNADEGAGVEPYAQEVPYASRKAVLDAIKADVYEDFGALDVHTVAAGATNDHIDASYQPMDEEADEFERHIREGIQDILALQGIEATPVFSRNRISNVKEQVEVVVMEAEWLDEETVLRKLPNVTPDEVAAIMERRDAEAAERLAALPPALAANAQGQAQPDDRSDGE